MDVDKLKDILLDYIQLLTESDDLYDNHTDKLIDARRLLEELEDLYYDKLTRKASY